MTAAVPPVVAVQHRGLGRLLQLTLPEGPPPRLTPAEAQTLARALLAVAEGRSGETEIFLSPIASDGVICGRVIPGRGVSLNGLTLDWPAVRRLAETLAEG